MSVFLIGAGGQAASACDVLSSRGLRVVAASGSRSGDLGSIDHCDTDEELLERASAEGGRVLVAVGDNGRRAMLYDSLPPGLRLPAVTAGSASVAESCFLGAGSVVHHHAHVGPRAQVGDAVIVNTAAVLEHDCVVADAVHIAPAATILGGAWIGEGALVGSGARVLPNLRVGAFAVIGAGAVVVTDVPDGATVVGVPARRTDRP